MCTLQKARRCAARAIIEARWNAWLRRELGGPMAGRPLSAFEVMSEARTIARTAAEYAAVFGDVDAHAAWSHAEVLLYGRWALTRWSTTMSGGAWRIFERMDG